MTTRSFTTLAIGLAVSLLLAPQPANAGIVRKAGKT